jgi:hypothetical protein
MLAYFLIIVNEYRKIMCNNINECADLSIENSPGAT